MSVQQIKTLQTILKQQADNCVALTYNLDLPFFEYMFFEPLYNGGCRNITVLCDPRQYEAALDDVPALKHLGHRYLCLPSSVTRAAFHPKLILLTSKDAGLLLVGSGNLSRPGLTHNQEVWTQFAYTNSVSDERIRAVFRWAIDYLGRISEIQKDPMLRQRLDQLWQTTGWLRNTSVSSDDDSCWLLHNLDHPILDQLVDRWREYDSSPVREAAVISPYFDKRSLVFKSLLDRLHPERITLTTEFEAPGLNPDTVHRLLDNAGVSLSSQRLELDSRRLHAKLLALRTEQGSWVLTGSPNFSRPAMLQSVEDGNAELAVLRYEPDPTYVDLVLRPITEKAVPMALEWTPSLEETEEVTDRERSAYRLLRAEVNGTELSVVVEPEIADHARLRIELSGREVSHFEVEEWERKNGAIVLELPENVHGLISVPASIQLTVEAPEHWKLSTRTVVNNTVALQTNSRPARRQERASVPEGFVSEQFEQDIELLSRLQNLLALNPQQLRDHRGISRQTDEELRREDLMAVSEEDYDPEAMIVGEQLQRIDVRTGSELYVDFYERTFYEDVLAAARAAVYRPMSDTEPEQDVSSDGHRESRRKYVADQSAIEKVTKGFVRLVKNFERGMQDSEYLRQVSPTYLQELFFILTTFLRSLWLQDKVNDENFFALSKRLFAAFLGDERESTGWPAISCELTEEQLTWGAARPYSREQLWMHLYLLAEYALVEDEDLLPDLARLLRLTARELSPATTLEDLPYDIFATMWRNSFSHDQSVPEAQTVASDLTEYSEWYSEETLRKELKQSLGATVIIERRGGWDLPAVPIMKVDGAWSDDHLDVYWQAFCKLCRWPKWKKNARLEVTDSNPTKAHQDTKRLILFYRNTSRRLTVLVNSDDETLSYKKQINGISLQELCELRHFNDAIL